PPHPVHCFPTRRSSDLGLGMFGIIGWSVSVPTVIGALLGVWLDRRLPGSFSWTLALLLGGVTLGCFNAWYWISQEREAIDAEEEDRKSTRLNSSHVKNS